MDYLTWANPTSLSTPPNIHRGLFYKAHLKDKDLEKLWPLEPKTLQFQTFLVHDNPRKFTKLQFCLHSIFITVTVYQDDNIPQLQIDPSTQKPIF